MAHRFDRFELTNENGEHIGTCQIREQAIEAAKGYAQSTGEPVTVTASVSDNSREPRSVVYHPDGFIRRIWDIADSHPFCPEEGQIYRNAGGGEFLCIKSDYTDGRFINIKSGWEFDAHGCRQYFDNSIEWDYSTSGHFTK